MFRQFVSALACASLFLAGCDTTEPAASGAYRVQSVKTGGPGANGEAPVRIQLTSSGNVAEADLSSIVAYVKIVAKREATKQQSMIAMQRARAAQSRLTAGQRAKTRYLAVETDRSAPTFDTQPASYVEGAPATRSGAAPKFDRSVMLWDTQTQSLVGNSVYDIKSVPPVGASAKFESYTAQYVGAGS